MAQSYSQNTVVDLAIHLCLLWSTGVAGPLQSCHQWKGQTAMDDGKQLLEPLPLLLGWQQGSIWEGAGLGVDLGGSCTGWTYPRLPSPDLSPEALQLTKGTGVGLNQQGPDS